MTTPKFRDQGIRTVAQDGGMVKGVVPGVSMECAV